MAWDGFIDQYMLDTMGPEYLDEDAMASMPPAIAESLALEEAPLPEMQAEVAQQAAQQQNQGLMQQQVQQAQIQAQQPPQQPPQAQPSLMNAQQPAPAGQPVQAQQPQQSPVPSLMTPAAQSQMVQQQMQNQQGQVPQITQQTWPTLGPKPEMPEYNPFMPHTSAYNMKKYEGQLGEWEAKRDSLARQQFLADPKFQSMNPEQKAWAMASSGSKGLRETGLKMVEQFNKPGQNQDLTYQQYQNMAPQERQMYDRFKGRFDYGGEGEQPAWVKTWEYGKKLPEEERKKFYAERRNNVVDMGPYMMNMSTGDTFTKGLAPKDQPQNVEERKQAEVRGTRQEGRAWDRKEAWPKARGSYNNFVQTYDNQKEKISRAIDKITPMSAGFGGTMLSMLPGTEARNVQQLLKSVQARLAFEELNKMRQNSPTGGAVGQLTDNEREALAAAVQPIFQDQTVDDLIYNLNKLDGYMDGLYEDTANAFGADWGDESTRDKDIIRQSKKNRKKNSGAAGGAGPQSGWKWE